MFRFSESSDISVGAEDFLSSLTLRGVNTELWPLVRMTAPGSWANRPIVDWPVQKHLFNSWILILGLLPADRHRFYLRSVTPGEGFVEASSSTINAKWTHERRITPVQGGCRIVDRVEYRCRLAMLGYLLLPVYKYVFRRRHRNLRARYGGHRS